MKTPTGRSTAAAATALAALHLKEKKFVERSFNHLTAGALQKMDESLLQELQLHVTDDGSNGSIHDDCHLILAKACIRRIVHRCLDKYSRLQSSAEVVEDALHFYTLPIELQQQLASKYGGNPLTQTTWYDALDRLKALSTTENAILDRGKLWRLILDHPMTAYVPVQCQSCGLVVPDQYPTQQTDAEVGLREIVPTGDELELRAGWFRGPRKAVIFQFTCPLCQTVSNWYRSGHPKILLNPNRWGRLCGDQEELRLTMAGYLNVNVRLAMPLDWDHVWSEYNESPTAASAWQVRDGSDRNFCCRLDEGIGSCTRIWAIHPNPNWCKDLTQDYLACQQKGGRTDNNIDDEAMERYEKIIKNAREDRMGGLTQAKTVNGYVLNRANLSDDIITAELQIAARDYGKKEWWQCNFDNDIL